MHPAEVSLRLINRQALVTSHLQHAGVSAIGSRQRPSAAHSQLGAERDPAERGADSPSQLGWCLGASQKRAAQSGDQASLSASAPPTICLRMPATSRKWHSTITLKEVYTTHDTVNETSQTRENARHTRECERQEMRKGCLAIWICVLPCRYAQTPRTQSLQTCCKSSMLPWTAMCHPARQPLSTARSSASLWRAVSTASLTWRAHLSAASQKRSTSWPPSTEGPTASNPSRRVPVALLSLP